MIHQPASAYFETQAGEVSMEADEGVTQQDHRGLCTKNGPTPLDP